MKKQILILMASTCLALVGCSKDNGNKTLKVGTSADYPPFEYVENGQIKGLYTKCADANQKLADSLKEMATENCEGNWMNVRECKKMIQKCQNLENKYQKEANKYNKDGNTTEADKYTKLCSTEKKLNVIL